MIAFMRALRFFPGAKMLSAEPPLWKIMCGLGFKKTIEEFGYAWFKPLFNWRQMVFRDRFADKVLFPSPRLLNHYNARASLVGHFYSEYERMSCCKRWFRMFRTPEVRERKLPFMMVHYVLLQFRRDAYNIVASRVVNARDSQLGSNFYLAQDHLRQLLGGDVKRVQNCNRTAYKTFDKLFDYLFGLDDGQQRKNWDFKGYRALLRQARDMILQNLDASAWRSFYVVLSSELARYHWILPYPCKTAWTQTDKSGRANHLWWALAPARLTNHSDGILTGRFLGDKPWRGLPPSYPSFLSLTSAETLQMLQSVEERHSSFEQEQSWRSTSNYQNRLQREVRASEIE